MASATPWTWVWVNSESWWWTGRHGVLQSMGSQRVRHYWATEQQQWKAKLIFIRGCASPRFNGVTETEQRHFLEQNCLLCRDWRRAFWLTMRYTSLKMEMASWGSWHSWYILAGAGWDTGSLEAMEGRRPSLLLILGMHHFPGISVSVSELLVSA